MLRLFKKRHIWLPTLPALLLFLVGVLLLGGLLFFASHDFLAANKPAPGAKLLVVESWVADRSLEKVAALLNGEASPYESVWLTGPVLDRGIHLAERYKTYSEVAAATLGALGVAADKIHIAPAAEGQRHRTHGAAVKLKEAFDAAGKPPDSFDLVTLDVHARRSRLVFAKVFEDTEIGVIALPPEGYDADGWFKTSAGMKNTVFEVVAYLYEKFGDGGR